MKGRLTAILGLAVLVGGTVILRSPPGGALASIPLLIPPVIQPASFIRKLAFEHGERMVFRFGWNDIPAAEMTMTVEQLVEKGRTIYRYHGSAMTLPHVSWIYALNDQVDATLDAKSLDPLAYSLLQDENGKRTATIVRNAGETLLGMRVDDKQKEHSFNVVRDGSYDPVTIAYLARSVPAEVGQSYSYKVFDGHYQYVLTLNIEKREMIRIKAGSYRALRIRPTIQNVSRPDRPQKVKQATLWVSDDDSRVPLRLESEVFFGKVYGELVAYSK